jgi:plasmid stabilization system protein ParE
LTRILISEDALDDLNEGFRFYEAQEFGLGDYFTACLRSDIEGLKLSAGNQRVFGGFHRLLSHRFPHGIFYTLENETATIWAVIDLRRDPNWILEKLTT